jgi:hypothetical protein
LLSETAMRSVFFRAYDKPIATIPARQGAGGLRLRFQRGNRPRRQGGAGTRHRQPSHRGHPRVTPIPHSAIMKKENPPMCLAALKPRNLFALLARKRAAGGHAPAKRQQAQQQKDLVQRLREAGL